MHAVVFQVDMKDAWEGDPNQDLDALVAFSKTAPGFVKGIWTGDERRGLSILVFDSEQAARAVAEHATPPPDGPVTLRSADVYEVHREA